MGDIPPQRMAHLRSSRWLDLETLTSVRDLNGPEWSRERVHLFYSQSWALTHMLVLSADYRTRFEEFANALHQGATAAAAFAKVYGKSLEQVQRDLAGYVRSDRFAAALFDVKLEKLAEAPRVQPVPEVESGLLLSELLVLLGRDAEAEKSLEKLEARMPGRWEIAAVRGRAALRGGRFEEALRYLARAADSEEAGADVRLEYARLLAASGENVEAAIRQLEKVLQAEPESAEAHYYLGLMLLRRAEYGRALGSFARVRNLPPELAYPFFMALSRTYYHLGDRAEALKAAQRARQYVRSDEEAKAAAQLVGALEAGGGGELVAEVPSDSFRMPEERPEVRRRPAGPPPPAPPEEALGLPSISGALEQVDCLGNRARLRIMSAGRQIALLVEDPAAVVVVGEAGILELTCGPQKPRPVTIEYRPRDDPETGTIGVAVLIRLP